MARPIEATPVIIGEEAKKLIDKMNAPLVLSQEKEKELKGYHDLFVQFFTQKSINATEERKVSLEDIAIELWSLFDTNNEIKWSEIHESLRHFYMIRAQAILSLINATEERKGEE